MEFDPGGAGIFSVLQLAGNLSSLDARRKNPVMARPDAGTYHDDILGAIPVFKAASGLPLAGVIAQMSRRKSKHDLPKTVESAIIAPLSQYYCIAYVGRQISSIRRGG